MSEIHLSSMLTAFGTAALVASFSYVVPGMEQYRPWQPGDPIPVIASLVPSLSPKVQEDDRAGLVAVEDDPTVDDPSLAEMHEGEEVAPSVPAATPAMPAAGGAAVPPAGTAATPAGTPSATGTDAAVPAPAAGGAPESKRSKIGVPTPLEDTGHVGMKAWYRALKAAGEGKGVARALHYGDSTIAADGLARTIRSRLQSRFGNAGPGFISAGMDPRWNKRSDVDTSRSGEWTTKSILNGGASGRYGLGGIVGIGQAGAYATLRAVNAAKTVLPMKHLELWYQTGAGYGGFWASVDDKEVANQSAAAEATADQRFTLDVPEGFSKLAFGVTGGPVPWYGVVLESGGPGVTWEALGVIGVGSKSFTTFNRAHLNAQMAQRNPDLVTVMLGGNEAGWPALMSGDGSSYVPYYRTALDIIRAGAPNASCLVIAPLDQGTREEDVPTSKKSIPRMVAAQRTAAQQAGCGFWSAFDAMGGSGAIVKWSSYKYPLAWTDLIHLSGAGLEIIGNLLSDAMLQDYDAWVAEGSP